MPFKLLTQRDLHWPDVAPGAVVAGLVTTVFQLAGGYIIARSVRMCGFAVRVAIGKPAADMTGLAHVSSV